jgi:hypothetical protein
MVLAGIILFLVVAALILLLMFAVLFSGLPTRSVRG